MRHYTSNIPALGRECHSGKQKACDQLAEIATQNKKSSDRYEAVGELSDQTLLARIAMQDPDSGVRRAAVEKLIDQSALVKIAVKETNDEVAQTALGKVADQSLLLQAALEAAISETRLLAVYKLTDQTLLSRVALEDTDAKARTEAVDDLKDQTLLKAVATQAKDPKERAAAMWKVMDQSFLLQIADNDPDPIFREAARLAADWKSVQTEHEVYVWKQPSESPTSASKPSWRIRAVRGGLGIFSNSESWAPGFKPWAFQPESDQDSLVLESGSWSFVASGSRLALAYGPGSSWSQTIGGNQPTFSIPYSAPTSFTRHTDGGSSAWAVVSPNSVLIFEPEIHVSWKGTLEMGGMWEKRVGTIGQPGSSVTTSQLPDVAVEIVGEIRFPADRWTRAGAGFEIMGGGLQFDGTGVFLAVGTQYRKSE